jgi:hypothetical protein
MVATVRFGMWQAKQSLGGLVASVFSSSNLKLRSV